MVRLAQSGHTIDTHTWPIMPGFNFISTSPCVTQMLKERGCDENDFSVILQDVSIYARTRYCTYKHACPHASIVSVPLYMLSWTHLSQFCILVHLLMYTMVLELLASIQQQDPPDYCQYHIGILLVYNPYLTHR